MQQILNQNEVTRMLSNKMLNTEGQIVGKTWKLFLIQLQKIIEAMETYDEEKVGERKHEWNN